MASYKGAFKLSLPQTPLLSDVQDPAYQDILALYNAVHKINEELAPGPSYQDYLYAQSEQSNLGIP